MKSQEPQVNDTLSRGFASVEEARFSRFNLLPIARNSSRWNLVVAECFRIVELLIKGLSCLAGNVPKANHELDQLLTNLFEHLLSNPGATPLALHVVDDLGEGFAVDLNGGVASILHVSNLGYATYSQLGSSAIFTFSRPETIHIVADGEMVSVSVAERTVSQRAANGMVFRGSFGRADAAAVDELKRLAAALRKHREVSLYHERRYLKEHALEAIGTMEAAFAALAPFIHYEVRERYSGTSG
jgi:HEPN domain-containing protein